MIVRKTLEQVKAEGGGRFDKEKFDSLTDADIERMIDEDPDLAPRTETLMPYLEARDVRQRLGLTQKKFAQKLWISVTAVRDWERNGTPADPVLQALLRILDRIPDPALRALDEPGARAEGQAVRYCVETDTISRISEMRPSPDRQKLTIRLRGDAGDGLVIHCDARRRPVANASNQGTPRATPSTLPYDCSPNNCAARRAKSPARVEFLRPTTTLALFWSAIADMHLSSADEFRT